MERMSTSPFFFWSNRYRAHHDVVRKYDDSDVEML